MKAQDLVNISSLNNIFIQYMYNLISGNGLHYLAATHRVPSIWLDFSTYAPFLETNSPYFPTLNNILSIFSFNCLKYFLSKSFFSFFHFLFAFPILLSNYTTSI